MGTGQGRVFDALAKLRRERPDLRLPTPEEGARIDAAMRGDGYAWVWDFIPRRAPLGWRYVACEEAGNGVAASRKDGLRVIADGARKVDGLRWLHVSCSRESRLPSYHDLKDAKRTFIGDRLYAYQVFAPPARHVNLNEVLHLWACVDRPMYLPDMTWGFDTI